MAFSPRELSPTTATADVAWGELLHGNSADESESTSDSGRMFAKAQPSEIVSKCSMCYHGFIGTAETCQVSELIPCTCTLGQAHTEVDRVAQSSKPLHARPGGSIASGAIKLDQNPGAQAFCTQPRTDSRAEYSGQSRLQQVMHQ